MITEQQLEHMIRRFLQWKLPEDFAPDAGISFKREYNENTPWPSKHEPVGTNLFNYNQAKQMILYMFEGHNDSIICPTCNGDGNDITGIYEYCKNCNGTGQI